MIYAGLSRNTIKKYERQGKIVPGTTDPSNPERKFWYVKDLDQLKLGVEAYKNRRGTRFQPIGKAENSEHSLARQTSLEAGLMEMSTVPPNFTLAQGQTLIRWQLLEMAKRNKVISRLFALLDSPDGKVQLSAIHAILAKILPDLKSIEHVTLPDEGTVARQERTLIALETIRKHLSSLPGPIEGSCLVLPDSPVQGQLCAN